MTSLQIEVESEVTRRIRQHARAHMATEVCGVLIGDQRDGVLTIRALIEALDAAQAGTHVTFTQDAWETIYKVKDESYPEERIVGWYHSHPGFGVFLSDQDLFIHQNFFSAPDQVAWVYDPHSDEEGCFGWHDGAIHRVAQWTTSRDAGVNDQIGGKDEPYPASSSGQPDAEAPEQAAGKTMPSWLAWTATCLSYLAVLLLGAALAYVFLPHVIGIPVDPATGQPLLTPAPSSGPTENPGSGGKP